ncbi:MAG: hypothetical protein IKW60_00685 [Clostridia bacterium]|nr:hypothetical protein [Clostridia bacterium]
MSEEKKKFKNLFHYTLCMILAVIILILFAAMADSREEHFETQIVEKERINSTIQNQIVTLTDENYKLKQENEEMKNKISQQETSLQIKESFNLAFTYYLDHKKEDAMKVLETIKDFSMTEEEKKTYTKLQKLFK